MARPVVRTALLLLLVACSHAHGNAPADAEADAAAIATDATVAGVDASHDAAGCVGCDAQPDPCANVTCDAPPQPSCSAASTLVTYGASTCSAGTCHYAPATQTCDAGCYGTACVGPATNACGVCDRDWQCDAALDHWSSFYDVDGLGCRDDRTGTTLRCNGSLDNDADDSWAKTTWGMELVFGGVLGEHEVDCSPPA